MSNKNTAAPPVTKPWTIKADRTLFDAWQELGERVKRMGTLVQNDMELPDPDLAAYEHEAEEIETAFNTLFNRTRGHISTAHPPR